MARAVRTAAKNSVSRLSKSKSKDRSHDYNLLMKEYAPLIMVSVDQISRHNKLPLDHDDLVAAALTGLFEALEKFDPSLTGVLRRSRR